MALTFVTRDRKTHDFSEDQEILMMTVKGAIPDLFDSKHTEFAVIGYEAGKPYGFMTIALLHGHAILEHFGMLPRFWTSRGRKRLVAMVNTFLPEVWARGYPYMLSRVEVATPHYEKVETLMREWGARPYTRINGFEWWVMYNPYRSAS